MVGSLAADTVLVAALRQLGFADPRAPAARRVAIAIMRDATMGEDRGRMVSLALACLRRSLERQEPPEEYVSGGRPTA